MFSHTEIDIGDVYRLHKILGEAMKTINEHRV